VKEEGYSFGRRERVEQCCGITHFFFSVKRGRGAIWFLNFYCEVMYVMES